MSERNVYEVWKGNVKKIWGGGGARRVIWVLMISPTNNTITIKNPCKYQFNGYEQTKS